MKRQGGACFLVLTRAVLGVPGHLPPAPSGLPSGHLCGAAPSVGGGHGWPWVHVPRRPESDLQGCRAGPEGNTSPRAGLGWLTTGCDGPAIEQAFLPPWGSASAPTVSPSGPVPA